MCENEIQRLTREQSENAWTMRNLGAIEMFGSVEEIVYEIVDIVIRAEVSPENMN